MTGTMDDLKIYCFSGFVKHASLVNKIYPGNPGEEGPRSSDLSYLTFYASHRPEKLTKVGKYLYKKYLWDASKDRRAHHKVTLAILNALMDTCSIHLCSFAHSLVLILSDMSYSSDPELTTYISACFIKFCSHYDASLDANPQFYPLFITLIDRFCFLALPSSHSSNESEVHDVHQLKLAGLEAMKAIAFSSFIFTSPNALHYAAKIIPPILSNIRPPNPSPTNPSLPLPQNQLRLNTQQLNADAKEDAEYLAFSTHQRLSIFDDVINDDELSTVALKALHKLARAANASAIVHVLNPVFTFLDVQAAWTNTRFVVLVMQTIVSVCSTPMQTIVLSQILTRLKHTPSQPEFKHISQAFKILPHINLGINCLAITLTEIIDTLASGVPTFPDLTQTAFIWLTRAFIPTALKELIVTLVPRIEQFPTQLTHVVQVLLAEPKLSINIIDLEPFFVILSHSEPAYTEPKQILVQLLYQSAPSIEVSSITKLAPYLKGLDIQLILYHWIQHPKQVSELVKLASQDLLFEPYALAALAAIPLPSLKAQVPELQSTESHLSLQDLPTAKIMAILNNGHLDLESHLHPKSPLSRSADDIQSSSQPAEITAKPPEMMKTHSVLQFGSIERKATPEEFHNILNGKSVLERPVSMGSRYASFQFPINKTELDNVLDNI